MSIPISTGSGAASVAAEAVAGLQYQQVEVLGAGGASTLGVNPDRSINVSVIGTLSVSGLQGSSVSGTVGASIVGQLPGGTAVLGSIVALQGAGWSGSVAAVVTNSLIATITNSLLNIAGSVASFQAGSRTISGSVLTMFAPVASLVSGVSSMITGTGQTSVLATPAGAQRNYITQIIVTNAAAVGTVVNIMDGPNVMYAGFAAASGGGFTSSFPTPLKQSNLVTSVDVKAITQASVLVAIVGYTGA